MKHEIELKPFLTPSFAIPVRAPGTRGDGFSEAPPIPLSELNEATLEAMCNKFKEDVFAKAGKGLIDISRIPRNEAETRIAQLEAIIAAADPDGFETEHQAIWGEIHRKIHPENY
jgi:hypothetical protein